MYLNTNLALPTSGASTNCRTPKTPEILNSIISLTCPVNLPSPVSSSQYECQGSISDVSSPGDNVNSFEDQLSAAYEGSPLFQDKSMLCVASPPYDATAKSLEFAFGLGESSIGTPSPPIPELPSPIQPMEATKSALIKEGLKYQIQTKLHAAGLSSPTAFSEQKVIKEELTVEDEDRRKRRRERNKVAATKCRNKKKERTCILVNESEEVEGENMKLKNEIERLKCEKMKLERLLEDPNHIACCLRTKRVSSLTPTDAPVVTCSQNVAAVADHYPVPSNSDARSTGMSYSTLSIPSPVSTSYMYTGTTHFGSLDNKSKFSSYPLTCNDPLKCVPETEDGGNSFLNLPSLTNADLNDKSFFADRAELNSNSMLTAQFSQCLQDSRISTMAGNFTNHITNSILESGPIYDSPYNNKDPLTSLLKGDTTSLISKERICAKYDCEAKINEKLLKPTCLAKTASISRFCPYERTTVGTPVSEYTEHILARNNFNANHCGQNVTNSFSAEYNRELYPTCTFE